MPALGMARIPASSLLAEAAGDAIKTGDVLMEVETDKSTVEVEAGCESAIWPASCRPACPFPGGGRRHFRRQGDRHRPGEARGGGSTQDNAPASAAAVTVAPPAVPTARGPKPAASVPAAGGLAPKGPP
jgi:hypothetical protein